MSDLTMTVRDLVAASTGLNAIGGIDIPKVAASYALAKAKRKAAPELKTVEEQRLALCVRHAEKDESGAPRKESAPDGREQFVFADRAAFARDFDDLLDQPVTLTGVRAVTVAELDGAVVAPDILLALGPFVSDE